MKLQFAVDYEHKGRKVGAGKTLDVDSLEARPLIHLGIARVAADDTKATAQPKAAEKKEA